MFYRKEEVRDENYVPGAVLHLVKEAWFAQYWIYDSERDVWYTPEEFKANWRRVYKDDFGGRDNIDRFKIKNPYVGFATELDRVNKAHEKMCAFRKKLEDYFNLKVERKNNYTKRAK